MNRFIQQFDESARTAVTQDETVPGWSVGLVLFGICLTLPTLYTGAITAGQLGFVNTAKAIGLASAVLALMSIPAAIVGARTRLSSYLIIEFVFGRKGSDYVNALLAFSLLGWFAVTAGFFGQTLAIALSEIWDLSLRTWPLTLISSLLILLTTLFGFRAIDRLALFAVPLLVCFLIYVSMLAMTGVSWGTVLSIQGTNPDYFFTAVSTVIGSLIVGVVLMPDLSRYARTTADCVSASLLGNGLGNFFAMLMGVLPAMVTGQLDPMAYMIALGLVGSAFIILVFATWTTNSVNLYSTTLAVAVVRTKTPEWQLMLASGVVGTGLAVLGITEHFIVFLEWLGVIVPPIAGIYLVDYFVLRQRRFSPDLREGVPDYDKAAMVAWVIGTIISAIMFLTESSFSNIPSLDALVVTAPIYLACRKRWPSSLSRSLSAP